MDALVSRLRAQGSDDAHVEVKSCGGGLGKSFWESVSAFANTTGGLFVLGLDENQGFTPARGFKDKQVIDQVVSGMTVGDGAKVEPSPLYEIDRARVDGASVVVVRVHQNQLDAKPCFVRAQGIKTGSYKRIDDKDLRLSAAEIYEMQTALVPGNSDRVAVDTATAQDLAPELVERLLSGMGSSRALRGTTSPEEKLQRLNVVTESGELSLAGLLTLGAYPQQFEPALIVDVTAHPGTVKSVAGPGPRFLDRELCEGTIPEIVAGAVDAVARNLRTVSVVEGVGRQDRLEIPRQRSVAQGVCTAVPGQAGVRGHLPGSSGGHQPRRVVGRQNRGEHRGRELGMPQPDPAAPAARSPCGGYRTRRRGPGQRGSTDDQRDAGQRSTRA
jgi:ATP-dependent DNA helicase RecG